MCLNYKNKEVFLVFLKALFSFSQILFKDYFVPTFHWRKGWLKPFKEPATKYVQSGISCMSEGRTLREVFRSRFLISFVCMSQKRLTNSKHWAHVVPTARVASASWIRKPEFSSMHLRIWTPSPVGDRRINLLHNSRHTYIRTTWPWFSLTISR